MDTHEYQEAEAWVKVPKFQDELRANFGVSEYSECSVVVIGVIAAQTKGEIQLSGDSLLRWEGLYHGLGYMRTVFLGQGIPQSVLDDASTAWAKRWSIPSLQGSMMQDCTTRIDAVVAATVAR